MSDIVGTWFEKIADWSKRRFPWYYKTDEVDALDIYQINKFLVEWEEEQEEEMLDMGETFQKCCLGVKFIENIREALLSSPYETQKQIEHWKESMQNVKDLVDNKLNLIAFRLLQNGENYVNKMTGNLECLLKDRYDEKACFTMILWSHLHKYGKRGVDDEFGFSFKIPGEFDEKEIVVRLLHTAYDSVSPTPVLVDSWRSFILGYICEELDKKEKILSVKPGEEVDVPEHGKESYKFRSPKTDGQKQHELKMTPDVMERLASLIPPDLEDEFHVKESNLKSQDSSSMCLSKKFHFQGEPEIEILDTKKYYVVGGVFRLDFFAPPKIIVKKKGFTYIPRDEEKLRRIYYKKKIIPPVSWWDPVEKKKFKKILADSIFMKLQLPNVIYMEEPIIARFYEELNGFSKTNIYEQKYYEDTKQISFVTNEPGSFVALKRKNYLNYPYRGWYTTADEEPSIMLLGSLADAKIKVSEHGYKIAVVKDRGVPLPHLTGSEWVTLEYLKYRLNCIGVDIEVGDDIIKELKIKGLTMPQFKDEKIENYAYSVIGMFSTVCEFRSSHWNHQLYPNRVMMRYRLLSEFVERDVGQDYKIVYFCPDGVLKFSREKDVEDFLQQDQEEQNKLNYASALDILTEDGNAELFKNIQASTSFINNWIYLLRCCRPLSIR